MKYILFLLIMISSTIFSKENSLRSMRDSIGNVAIENRHNLNGSASFYGGKLHGSIRADGGRFNQWDLTAAHKTLPFGTKLKVTNLDNGNSVIVTINDRGPYKRGRVIDLSRQAFRQLDSEKRGILKNISIEVLKMGDGKRYRKGDK